MERILFVIEDDHVAGMLRAILSARVPADAMPTVRSADDAIAYLRQHPINALVMEASAQILGRFSLQTLIQHRYPTLPLVVLGGEPAAANAPALTIVPAPFSMAAVETALLDMLAAIERGASASRPPAEPLDGGTLAAGEFGPPGAGEPVAVIAEDAAFAAGGAGFDLTGGELLAAIAEERAVAIGAGFARAGGGQPDAALARVAAAPAPDAEQSVVAEAGGRPAPGDPGPAAALAAPAGEAGAVRKDDPLPSAVRQALAAAMQIEGALGVALADYQSGMALGAQGGGAIDLEVAAAGAGDVIRAKMRVMDSLGLGDGIEDMLITLGAQYHLIRLLSSPQGRFIYLILSRGESNLALARHQLSQIEATLSL